ncbi:MAG: hypothetical protein K0S71_1887 [Clostridia bacterium]|jgi:hypothetical protein|nr:hypothetical protein [Clostridia bacterium]
MRRNIVKITMLVMLVALCMWQIVILWLGDMSSHNFLGKRGAGNHVILVQPKAIWVNVGKLVYKIDGSRNEYSMLINEISGLVVSGVKTSDIEKDADMTYEDLLSMPGILYEYDLELGLQELVGSDAEILKSDIGVNQVFIDMSRYNDHMTNFYLVTDDTRIIYAVTLYERLEGHQKIMERFNNPDATRNLVGYQPSTTSNKKQYIRRNNFLPLNTKEAPIEYDILQVSNPIENMSREEKIEELEQYVNSFFANPLLKEIDERQDGSIIFSENMRAIVKYEPRGTLEFSITSANEAAKLTPIERLTKVMGFVEACTGIPRFLKEGMYLSEIVNQGEEYIYKFDYKYKGFTMQLTNPVKEELGLDHILEITIKNNQVIKGKWSILRIEPKESTDADSGDGTDTVPRGFDEIVDTMYELYVPDGYETLDAVQCQYIMSTTEGKMNLDWVVQYLGDWYYP